jgi:hypothetical protein
MIALVLVGLATAVLLVAVDDRKWLGMFGVLTVLAVAAGAFVLYRARPDLMDSGPLAVALAVGACLAGHSVRLLLVERGRRRVRAGGGS